MRKLMFALLALPVVIALSFPIGAAEKAPWCDSCRLIPGFTTEDSTWVITSIASNTNAWPAKTWFVASDYDTTLFTVTLGDGSSTLEIYCAPGRSFNQSNYGGAQATQIAIDRKSTSALAQAVACWDK